MYSENLVSKIYIDGLVQERRNSIANTLELRLSCTNPSIYLFGMVDVIGHCDFHCFSVNNWTGFSCGIVEARQYNDNCWYLCPLIFLFRW